FASPEARVCKEGVRVPKISLPGARIPISHGADTPKHSAMGIVIVVARRERILPGEEGAKVISSDRETAKSDELPGLAGPHDERKTWIISERVELDDRRVLA